MEHVLASYTKLLKEFAQKANFKIAAAALVKTQEIIIDDQAIGLHLETRPSSKNSEVVCFTQIGSLPSQHMASILPLMLQANNCFAENQGATLSLYGPNNNVMMAIRAPLDWLTPELLGILITRLAQDALRWKTILMRHVLQEPKAMVHPFTTSF